MHVYALGVRSPSSVSPYIRKPFSRYQHLYPTLYLHYPYIRTTSSNMKATIILASLLALVGAASIPEKRQEYPDCEPTTGAFYFPDTVTVGEPFSVRFCSSTYFKTSSQSITLAITRTDDSIDGAVILTEELKGNKRYDFEATVPMSQITFPNSTYLAVVEKINDYYVSSSYDVTTAPVTVVYPST